MPKKKKRTSEMRQAALKENSHSCILCGRPFSQPYFNKCGSPFITGTGYLPVCKECLKKLFYSYYMKYDMNEKKAVKRVCMLYGLYYSDRIFYAIDTEGVTSKEQFITKYIRHLNLNRYIDKTFDDSLDEGFLFDDVRPEAVDVEIERGDYLEWRKDRDEKNREKRERKKLNEKIKQKNRVFWGDGFDYVDYKALDEHYDYLTEANPNYDSNQEIFIKDLCVSKMLKDKAAANGDIDGFKKLSELYRSTFKQAGLKTIDDVSGAEDFSIGVNLRRIEQYTPAEFYKDQNLYKDFDGLGDYFDRFVLRPLRNLQHGTTDRDKEYYVKDEGDLDVE